MEKKPHGRNLGYRFLKSWVSKKGIVVNYFSSYKNWKLLIKLLAGRLKTNER